MPIGPGPDDPENDNYDPAWHDQDTPFRRWIASKLAARNGVSPEFATVYAPANRYHGLNEEAVDHWHEPRGSPRGAHCGPGRLEAGATAP